MQENQNVDTQLQDAFSAFQNGRAGAQSAGEPETDQQSEDPSTQEKQGNSNEPNETQQTPDPSEKTNQAFAKMRTENSQLQKRQQDIEAVVKTMGYESIDDFLVKKAEEQLQQQAQKNQIPVGVEKRIQDLEKENERYRQHEQQERFGREVSNLVAKYNIDKASFDNFTAQLIANRINPMVTGVPLETYFIQFNPDFVYQQRLAEEKKKWEAELNKDKNAPITTPNGSLVPNPNETKSDPSKKTVDWKALAAKYAK